MYRILSIDGGGIRGIIPAMVLAKVEELTRKPICALFDLIAGTSTGAILALALSKPSQGGHTPQFSAEDLISFYAQEGKIIFQKDLCYKIRTLNGLRDAKYNAGAVESVLQQYFGKTMLSQSLTDVLVTAYELHMRTPFFFRSRLAKSPRHNGYDFTMWETARAASAAPTYFRPYKLKSGVKNEYYSLIDGGVYANNPAMCAYSEAKAVYGEESDIMLVSLGTGQQTRSIRHEDAKKWGLLGWAQPLFDICMDGVNDTTEYQLGQVMPKGCYDRLQVSLVEFGKDEMDNASPENINELLILGKNLVNENMENGVLPKICRKLLSVHAVNQFANSANSTADRPVTAFAHKIG